MYNIVFQPITNFISLKEKAKKAMERLRIFCLRDLLFYKPSSYQIRDTSSNFQNLKDGLLIQAEIFIDNISWPAKKSSPTKIYVSNKTGSLVLVFFNKIPPYIRKILIKGNRLTVAGKVQLFDGIYQINHPEFIFKKSLESDIIPVYPLTYGIVNKQLYGYILEGIKHFELAINTRISFGSIKFRGETIFENEIDYLQDLLHHIKNLHLIKVNSNNEAIEKTMQESILSLAYMELFANQASLINLKNQEMQSSGRSYKIFKQTQNNILNKLGFTLTSYQKQAIDDIEKSQASSNQMMKLLQGDVGSGKTLVALLTMVNVAQGGFQSSLMAPTDLLSIQHFEFFTKALSDTGIKVALLTGKTKIKERREIATKLKSGEIDILIGTHALFQDNVEFKNLSFIVIDEQHRFGVKQRLQLIEKGITPDVLVMTATPIPRSLTLTMFGDMSVALLKGKPKNRLPIITSVISSNKKNQLIEAIDRKLLCREKIYWVCPLIDQNDDILGEIEDNCLYSDISSRAIELEKQYPGQVGILHGKMKPNEKDKIMQNFKNGEFKILVATTVIEVGIDIKEASLMIIENAEKFGLAQLHQLRGRVGRGEIESHCILMYNPNRTSKTARNRLDIMKKSNDGFFIAEQDLILRGGGEVLGTKQSGQAEFFFADLGKNSEILLKANKSASTINNSEFINFQIRLFDKDKKELVKTG